MKKIKFILTIFLLIIYAYFISIDSIPEKIYLINNEKLDITTLWGIELIEATMKSNEESNVIDYEISLFDRIQLKNIKVINLENIKVVPVGKIVGLKMYTNGVLVVGTTELEDINNKFVKSFEESEIEAGDIIIRINEKEVDSIESLKEIVNDSNGEEIEAFIYRNGKEIKTSINPIEVRKNEFQLGLWVKDAATGVGTMTFYEPNSNNFGILGHGITDPDTNNLIYINSGELVTSKILSIQKGEKNIPGEIKGSIVNQKVIGSISKNTNFGVFGNLKNLTALNIDVSDKIDVAQRNEIKEGAAKLICSIDNNISKEYDIEIEKVYIDNNINNKSMLVRIVDEELLEKTGGIIRGLSGAPIVQNNKFVGAITNVLVSNPEIGYAIFADMMINEINVID